MLGFYLYTIMVLDLENIDEICEDIKYQYDNKIANMPLFKMTLVPEGDPVTNKAENLCKKYKKFKEKLDSMGVPSGVLIQASIGHGWSCNELPPFKRIMGLTDGVEPRCFCPYDEGFREYMYNAAQTIASYYPAHIMLDDDFRLLLRKGGGCACSLHMGRFNSLAGTSYTREELMEIFKKNSKHSERCATLFLQTQVESLLDCAKIIRQGIDSIDSSIPGSFCCVGNNAENAVEISKIMAGKGNPSIVRINNAQYTALGTKYFSEAFFRARTQIEKIKDKVDVILAETDTCPQNRYSTSAAYLHAHFTGSILEGVRGAKHWITRLLSYEPKSGKAYRKILSEYAGFYRYLADIVPALKWRGCRINVSSIAQYKMGLEYNQGVERVNGWSNCVLERLGLPMYFSSENGGVLCLEGNAVDFMSDESILRFLKGKVILASDAATALEARGFGEYIGVSVTPWNTKFATIEKTTTFSGELRCQKDIKQLLPTSDKTKVLSEVYFSKDQENYELLAPGVVSFENDLGGTVFTFCGTPKTNYDIGCAFSFLNSTRKKQISEMLLSVDELPAYYEGDEEVYFRAADMPDGRLFCAVFNLGHDPIDNTELIIHRNVSDIKTLLPNGTVESVDFEKSDKLYRINVPSYTLKPSIFFVE